MNRLRFAVLILTAVTSVTGLPGCGGDAADTALAPTTAGVTSSAASAPGNDVPERSSSFRFTDRTADTGIAFRYVNDEQAGYFTLLETIGGGAALVDFDLDRQLDVLLPGGGGYRADKRTYGANSGCFRNLGDWKFENAVHEAGIAKAPHYSHGMMAADYDNDGFPDVLVTGYGGLRLFHNCGDGTFEDVTGSAELTDTLWSSSAGWGDVDGDGNPDLYVAHYLNWSFDNNPQCTTKDQPDVCPPRRFEGLPDVLYISNGDGTFRNATHTNGLQPAGKGLGVLLADLDMDADLDIYVCNDTNPNFLYRNDGTGKFTDEALFSGTSVSEDGVPEGSMGVDTGDYNGDGKPDLWIVNYEVESFSLYRNNGNMLFQHMSRSTGVSAIGSLYVGWGTLFLDLDRDGDEDLLTVNGHVIRVPFNAPLLQKPLLLENLDGQRFASVAESAGDLNRSHMDRGLACGDIDRDGDTDVLITSINEPARLLCNDSPNEHHWIGIRLVGTAGSRDAVGAHIRLTTEDGRMQYRQITGGGSYASTSSAEEVFGLGAGAAIRNVEVTWPSAAVSCLESPGIDQSWTMIEARSKIASAESR